MAENDGLLRWLPGLLQATDAQFPTGGYAHSAGFEEFVRLAGVRNEADLRTHLREHVVPALANQELPYLRHAFEAADDPAGLAEVDREISAWKIARELREASIQLGRRRLAALRAVNDRAEYAEYANWIRRQEAEGHHLAVYGLQGVVEGQPLQALLAAYYYQSIAGVCGAALKLIRIGQEGCQRVLRECLGLAGEAVAKSCEVPREDAGWFDPLLEIASMRHEFANERLFIS
jgi:urease accessory protein